MSEDIINDAPLSQGAGGRTEVSIPVSESHSASIVSTSALLMVRQVVVAVSGAVATAVLARALSLSNFGIYSAALATFYLAVAVCDLGFATIFARELATAPHCRSVLLRSTGRAATIWSATVACLLVVGALAIQWDTSRAWCLLALGPALALTGLGTARQVFVVEYNVRPIAFVDLVSNLVMSAALIMLGLIKSPIWTLAATVSLFISINLVIVARMAWTASGSGVATWKDSVWLTRMALPFGLASFLASAYFSVDLVVAGLVLASAEVALYAAAVKVLTLVTTLPGLLMGVALPGIAAVNSSADRGELNRLVTQLWRFLLVVVGSVCWAILCFAPDVVRLLFGAQFHGAVPSLRVLMVAGLVALLAGLLGALMVSRHKGPAMFVQNLIALTANVGLNLLLLPRFGVIAAAWLTLLTEVFVCGCSAWTLRSVVDWSALGRACLAPAVSMAGFALVSIVPLDLWARLPLSLATLIFGFTVLRTWPPEIVRATNAARERVRRRTVDRARK